MESRRMASPDFPGDSQDLFQCKLGERVPEVDPADIKSVWQLYEDAAKRHRGQHFAIARGGVQAVCTPGANLSAVCYRRAMLRMLVSHHQDELRSWMTDGQLEEALFRAAARVPMQWMQAGVVTQDLPLKMEDFLRRVRGETDTE